MRIATDTWPIDLGGRALVALAALAGVHFPEAPEPRTADAVQREPGTRRDKLPLSSPDGTRPAYVARGPDDKEQLPTRLPDQASPAVLAGTEEAGV